MQTLHTFKSQYPEMFCLSAEAPDKLARFLQDSGFLPANEKIEQLAKAGDGNMNCVLRAVTPRRTFIAKQSRPWVEKYPAIAAPFDRVLEEARFYQITARHPELAKYMAEVLAVFPAHRLLLLQDLGDASDFSFLYKQKKKLDKKQLHNITEILLCLHQVKTGSSGSTDDPVLQNRYMRQLNHQHMFVLPFAPDNGLDLDNLTPGLSAIVRDVCLDSVVQDRAEALGKLYLSDGDTLLHGDYFPGSWLNTPNGIKIIDPEFGFYGLAEFDLGVLFAHLYLTGQTEAAIEGIWQQYTARLAADWPLCMGFTGIEMLRRLAGVAQLPLEQDAAWKKTKMLLARDFLMSWAPD